jgi:hypothetical protein
MKKYIYNSDLGRFQIRQTGHLGYQLWIKEEVLGEYANADFAAEDVAGFDTRHVKWDKFENKLENVPLNLSEWTPLTEVVPCK